MAVTMGLAGQTMAQRSCSTMENLDRLVEKDPRLVQKMDNLEQHIQRTIRNQKGLTQKATITIPVVFHVIYNNSTENISEEQVLSQLQVLQEDFNLQNSDYNKTPSEFAGLVANVGINFVMADTDPQGNPHSGITRTQTSKSSFGTNDDMKYTSRGGHDAWPADQYLNFWVCDLGSSLLGYAQFPGGSAETDGVVCHYKYTGTVGTATSPFHLGRTATHEVGHWLNLRHIWGDATCGNDYVDDTPTQLTSSNGCPSHPQNSCTSNDMFMNYMDYVNDACMYMFSEGQKERMLALFAEGGFRASFANGGGGTPPSNYCASKGNSVSDEWIANVTLNDFSNSTGANGGYADFTATEINLAPEENVSLSLSPGFSGSTYNEYWKIWIDYNGDYDFEDAGELVFDAGGTSSSTVTGSFTVSANAAGSTRMRVSMKYNGAQTSCESFSYGEVEDYTVVFGPPLPEVCDAPTGLAASNVSHNAFNISWDAMPNAQSYNVDFRASGSSNWTTNNTGSASYSFSGLDAETTYEYRVQTVCSEGSSGYGSVSSTTTGTPPPPAYCSSQGNDASSEWIQQVIIGSINNTSNGNGGYGNYTAQSFSAEQGEQVSFTLNPGFTSSLFFGENTQPEYWRIWIDYNQDYDFDDAGELVFDAGGTSTGNVSGSFTVSAGATLGNTRVRVSMKRSSAPSACGNFTYGEVEDYTINITEAAAPTCDAPGGIGTSNVSSSGFTLNWSAAANAQSYSVDMRASGGSWSSYSTSSTSYAFSGLNPETTYEYRVATVCSFGTSTYSSVGSVTTLADNPTPVTYCSSNGNSTSDEWISSVSIGDLSNSSGNNNGYADFTAQTMNTSAGASVSFNLSPGFTSGLFGLNSYPEYWRIWIDYNKDGDFDDAGELAFDAGGTSESSVSGSFTIPAGVSSGTTRMRVSMKYNGAPGSCESFSYGEVEDYTVSISSGARVINNSVQIKLFPNPVNGVVHLVGLNNAQVQILDVSGRVIHSEFVNSDRLSLTTEAWESGLYVARIIEGETYTQLKFVVE